MIEAILVVLSKAHPGRDDDLNDWYTNIHLRDALRFRGSIAAQRFQRSATQLSSLPEKFDWQYLALYDVFDAALFSREHWDNALTARMKITDAFDDSVLEDYHYYPLQFRDNDPETPHRGGVILEQINPAPGQEQAFHQWYNNEYLPASVRRPGVHSGAFLMFRTYGQMLPTLPVHRYVAIYRVNDAAAFEAWRQDRHLAESGFVDQATLLVTNWDKLTDRLTEDDVHHTCAAALAEEERARERMGDKIATGGREKLGIQ
jgi:hypothetical protein